MIGHNFKISFVSQTSSVQKCFYSQHWASKKVPSLETANAQTPIPNCSLHCSRWSFFGGLSVLWHLNYHHITLLLYLCVFSNEAVKTKSLCSPSGFAQQISAITRLAPLSQLFSARGGGMGWGYNMRLFRHVLIMSIVLVHSYMYLCSLFHGKVFCCCCCDVLLALSYDFKHEKWDVDLGFRYVFLAYCYLQMNDLITIEK